MELDGGNRNANTVDDSINCNLLQLSRAQEQDDKVKEITEEKESLILLRTQIRQDYGKEGLSEETKKSMNDQLSKIKNRLKVLAKKSQLITLSTEEVARLKSAHAQKQREYKMRKNSEFHSTKTLVIDLSNSFVNSKQQLVWETSNSKRKLKLIYPCNVMLDLSWILQTQSEESERW